MGKSVEAAITPDLLVWARESAGFSREQAAHRLGVEPDILGEWERGDSRPTIPRMRKISGLYKRPLALFYLPSRPRDFLPMHDFRKLPEAGRGNYSPELRYEMRLAHERRELALEMLEDEGEQPVKFTLSAAIRDKPEDVGWTIRRALEVTYAQQSHWREPRVAFHAWRGRIEQAGVLVFQAAQVETEEASGFAFAATDAPFMVVNRKDPWGRRVFSLLHEFAHLMLDTSGVSDLRLGTTPSHERRIEIFCNEVAASALMPKLQFLGEAIVAEGHPRSESWTDEAIAELARIYGVSREAVVRRMLTLGLTTESFYARKRAQYLDEFRSQKQRTKEREERKPVPRNVPREAVNDVGKPLIRLLLDQYHANRLSLSEVSGHLRIKSRHIERIEQGGFVD